MNLRCRRLVGEERAVSPVIAVILMVAVTVVLSTVIGTFVLGIGSQVTSTTPETTFGFALDAGPDGTFGPGKDGDSVAITHRGGDEIPRDQLSVVIANTEATATWPEERVSAGGTVRIEEDASGSSVTIEAGDTIRVIWTDGDGGGSAVLAEKQV